MTVELDHRRVDAAADRGVRNTQPEGIGRVVALGDLVCWNNLGRNLVFADLALRPLAIFGTTLFPDQDEPSQYDLDVHAVLDLPELGLVMVLNHLGALRGFRRAELTRAGAEPLVQPAALWWFVADVERTIAVHGRLVASAPREQGAIGLVVSPAFDGLGEGGQIRTRRCAAAFGEVTAIGVVPSPGDPLLALGGAGHVALVSLVGDQVGPPRWEAEVGFRVASVVWAAGTLWAAGPAGAGEIDDYDWDQLTGGGFAALDPASGRTLAGGPLPGDVAWGTGGVAVAPAGRFLAAAGRTGRCYLVDPRGVEGVRASAPVSSASLGIAHLAVLAGRVCCGFNRGGYWLHVFTTPGADRRAGPG